MESALSKSPTRMVSVLPKGMDKESPPKAILVEMPLLISYRVSMQELILSSINRANEPPMAHLPVFFVFIFRGFFGLITEN
jgi:hypothetical protein